jgi:hypothetical protein
MIVIMVDHASVLVSMGEREKALDECFDGFPIGDKPLPDHASSREFLQYVAKDKRGDRAGRPWLLPLVS